MSGRWHRYDDRSRSVSLAAGEVAPREPATVWVRDKGALGSSAKQRVVNEFTENYTPAAVFEIEFVNVDEYAEASFARLSRETTSAERAELKHLLEHAMADPKLDLLHEIRGVTGAEWTANEKRVGFFRELISRLAQRLDSGASAG